MLRAVTGQPDDFETRLLQEARYAFAEQHVILGDDDPHRHLPRPAVFSGISTVRFDSNVKTCAHRVRGLPLHYPAPSRAAKSSVFAGGRCENGRPQLKGRIAAHCTRRPTTRQPRARRSALN